MRLFTLFVFSICLAAETRVEIRSNEVWVVVGGNGRQLTRDGESKGAPLLSPSENRISYWEKCSQPERCPSSLVIVDLHGTQINRFQVKFEATGGSCYYDSGDWKDDTTIASTCHINPSLEEYVETNVVTGRTTRDLLGYGFTSSPDGKHVAHVAPYPHFAPPIAQSNYLSVDYTYLYPLPERAKPSKKAPDVVEGHGPRSSNIHEFRPEFAWSPDSKRVAFADCISDWIQTGVADDGATPIGDLANTHCFVVVVSLSGSFLRFPISGPLRGLELSWQSPRALWVDMGEYSKTYRIQ